jgi:hypothetical protein
MNWLKRSALVLVGAVALCLAMSHPAKADGVCWTFGSTPIAGLTLGYPSCDTNGYLNVDIASGTVNVGTITNPYNASTGQTAKTASFVGIAGFDGTTVDAIRTDTTGRIILGAGTQSIGSIVFPYNASTGQATVASTFVGIAGYDGTNADALRTDTTGRPIVVGAGTAGSPTGGVVSIQGVSGGTQVPMQNYVISNGAAATLDSCNLSTVLTVTATTAAGAAKIAGSSGKQVHICGVESSATNTNTSATLKIIDGTTVTNPCDTSQGTIAGPLAIGTTTASNAGTQFIPFSSFTYESFTGAVGDDYCFLGGGTAIAVSLTVSYGLF